MWRAWRVQLDGRIWMIVICPKPVNETGLKQILFKQFDEKRITKITPNRSLWHSCLKAKPARQRF